MPVIPDARECKRRTKRKIWGQQAVLSKLIRPKTPSEGRQRDGGSNWGRSIPAVSNDFQSIPITFIKILKRGKSFGSGICVLEAQVAGESGVAFRSAGSATEINNRLIAGGGQAGAKRVKALPDGWWGQKIENEDEAGD